MSTLTPRSFAACRSFIAGGDGLCTSSQCKGDEVIVLRITRDSGRVVDICMPLANHSRSGALRADGRELRLRERHRVVLRDLLAPSVGP